MITLCFLIVDSKDLPLNILVKTAALENLEQNSAADEDSRPLRNAGPAVAELDAVRDGNARHQW